MFTGIIEGLGEVISLIPLKAGKKLSLRLPFPKSELSIGQSISVNGVCLTLSDISDDNGSFFISPATIKTTNLNSLRSGDKVNLERPLRINQGLGGHILTGHIDSIGIILRIRGMEIRFSLPDEISSFLVQKGSIAIEGISLTVGLLERDYFDVSIIPHTWENTNLKYRHKGDRVNLEADLISKYIWHILSKGHFSRPDSSTRGLTREKLLNFDHLFED